MTLDSRLCAAALVAALSLAGCQKPGDQGQSGSATPAGTDASASAGANANPSNSAITQPSGTVGGGTTNDTSTTATGGAVRSGDSGSNVSGTSPIPPAGMASQAAGSTAGSTSVAASAPAYAPESDPTRTRNAADAARAGAQARGASGAPTGGAGSGTSRP